jgi:hypothetical protein
MPAPSRRYQSQLFNFILQQSIKWTDRAAKTLRHLQVATVWGIQALLYPIYVVVQATRNALGNSATSPTQELAPADETPIPAADTPIVMVLADLKDPEIGVIADRGFPEFPSETLKSPKLNAVTQWVKAGIRRIGAIVRVQENSSASIVISPTPTLEKTSVPQLHIRGIASLIGEQKLVLVDDSNQILDILSSQQQQQLERRIFIEIGNYWMAQQPIQPELQPQKKPNRLLAWMQTSPLAMSLNLFQEATLASLQKNTHSIPENTPDLPEFSTHLSSESPAALPASHVPSVNPVQPETVDRWMECQRSTLTSLAETQQFLVEKIQQVHLPQLSHPWQSSSETSQDDRSPTIPSEKYRFFFPETSRKALPKALETPEFYYHKISKIVKSVSDSFEKKLALVTDRLVQIADPWLSPLEKPEATDNENSSDDNLRWKVQFKIGDRSFKQLPASRSLDQPLERLQTWAKDSRNWLAEWGIPGLEPIQEAAGESASIVPEIPQTDQTPAQNEAIKSGSNPFVWESTLEALPHAPQSNWIDTEATSVEYIKHPLERILEWLDRIAFWIEEHIVQLWQGIQRFWHSSLRSNK